MTEQIENAEPAFPTRRALREAERRAAARGARRPRPAQKRTDDTRSARDAAPASVPTAASPQPVTPPSLPPAESRPAARPTPSRPAGRTDGARSRSSRLLGRGALLATLAAVTTGIPLSGAALPGSSTPSPSAFVASSALDVLTAEPNTGTDAFDTSFAADPLATARTLLTTGRTEGRDVLQCGSSELEANGQVAAGATTEPVQIMMPLSGNYRITSRYGYRWGGKHEGLDMAAPEGTPIHAVAAGEVTYTGFGLGGRSGMIIVLEHEIDGEKFWTWYIHMYPNGVFVDVGQRVSAGEVIGQVGSYGNSTGPHLPLEVHVNEDFTTVDPAVWLEEHDAAPLTAENLACAAG